MTLAQALHGLRRDILTLEFSLSGLRYRQQGGEKLHRQGLLNSLRGIRGTVSFRVGELKDRFRSARIEGNIVYLALPFEYKAARTASTIAPPVREYCFAEHLLLDNGQSLWWQLISRDKNLGKRETIIPQKRRKLLASYARGNAGHIGG